MASRGKQTSVKKNKNTKNKQKDKPASSIDSKNRYQLLILAIAFIFGIAYYIYISGLHENDLFFSHLSTLEREFTFRTEMGLYYSYYKTIVTADTMYNGISQLLNDNVTEYPETINILQRFNLYPELVLGVIFRVASPILPKSCFIITRGYGQEPIESCTGLGDISYFYVNGVFSLNGMQASLMFIIGCYLSGSIWGGAITATQFIFNLGEATRVMWTPPLRESFSFPFLFLQILSLLSLLRNASISKLKIAAFTLSTVGFMVPWQFAQFALLTQVLALLAIYIIGYLTPHKFQILLISYLTALIINLILQFFNIMLLTSLFFPCLLACFIITLLHNHLFGQSFILIRWLVQGLILIILTLIFKLALTYLLGTQDDSHIFNILRSKFTTYKDFDTQLYTCAAEFDFIGLQYVSKVCLTLLLPTTIYVVVMLVANYFHSGPLVPQNEMKNAKNGNLEGDVYYVAIQTIAFAIIASLIMRLKLFFTPLMCLLASVIAIPELNYSLISSSKMQRKCMIGYLLVCGMAGGYNIYNQLQIYGEYNNAPMEKLVEWINSSTPSNAVFAGSMSTMANIKLSTLRPIANHPHYENAEIRTRTRKIYQLFARVKPELVHSTLKSMGVNYVVVEDGFCYKESQDGCRLADMLALENPQYNETVAFCELLGTSIPHPFVLMYKNEHYKVLRIQN